MLRARALVGEALSALNLPESAIEGLFHPSTADFPVIFVRRLPLGASRFGMIGITLGRRVYLAETVRRYPPQKLIALLRHEAEHVLQQRSPLFYPRYVGQWLAGAIRALFSRSGGSVRWRLYQAYRNIQAEEEAYGAEELLRSRLHLMLGER
jgi:hypothetical protein